MCHLEPLLEIVKLLKLFLKSPKNGEEQILLEGGMGGRGNWHFKSSTNQTPRYAQPGVDGLEGWFQIELKILADVGLVGFPNAGKIYLTICNYCCQTKNCRLCIYHSKTKFRNC